MENGNQRTKSSYIIELVIYAAVIIACGILIAVFHDSLNLHSSSGGLMLGFVMAGAIAGWRTLTEHDSAVWHIPLLGFIFKILASAFIGPIAIIIRLFVALYHIFIVHEEQ